MRMGLSSLKGVCIQEYWSANFKRRPESMNTIYFKTQSISKLPLKLTFITKLLLEAFYTQKKPSKFFACGGHVSIYSFDSSTIKIPVFESISKLPLKLTKLLLGLLHAKNPQNFSPAAGVYQFILSIVLQLKSQFLNQFQNCL